MTVALPTSKPQTEPRSVLICATDSDCRERIASVVSKAGHECVGPIDPSDLPQADGWDAADCLVFAVERLSGEAPKTMASLRERFPEMQIVVACNRGSRTEIRRSLESGAAGVVVLDRISEVLPAAITAVCAGQVCVPAKHREVLKNTVLTTREKQILGLVVMGLTNAEIATKLYLAESTVKSHLSSAFGKLGVSSRSEAAAMILDPQSHAGLGILTIPTN